LHVDADAGALAALSPHTRLARLNSRLHVDSRPRGNERALQGTQGPAQVGTVPRELDDRAADHARRAVSGHVAAAPDRDDLRPATAQQFRRYREGALTSAATECVGGGTLDQEQQVVRATAIESLEPKFALQPEHGVVVAPAEIDHLEN